MEFRGIKNHGPGRGRDLRRRFERGLGLFFKWARPEEKAEAAV